MSVVADQKEGGDSEIEPRISPPLGLKLNKTPSFVNMVELRLSEARRIKATKNKNQRRLSGETSRSKNASTSNEEIEKTKASNFPALSVKIGSWQRNRKHEGDLIAKCYYGKKKMVWEFLDRALKSKIEIQWDDITAIRAILVEDEPGLLEIELKAQPLFFRETNPQPRKHTLWQPANDFTGGQASKCRRHYAWFPAGTLDKPYEKLLQCDIRLLELSRRPFPSSDSPYFNSNMYGISLDFTSPGLHYPFSAIPPHIDLHCPVQSLTFGIENKSPLSVIDFQPSEISSYDYMLENEMIKQGENQFGSLLLDETQLQEQIPTNVSYSCQGHHTLGYHEAAAALDNYDPSMDIVYGTNNYPADDSDIYGRINPMWFPMAQYGNNSDMTGLGYNRQENHGDHQPMFSENNVSDFSHAYSPPFGSLPPLVSDANLFMRVDNNLSYRNDSM